MHDFKYMSDGFLKLPQVPLHPNEYNYEQWDNGYATLKLLSVPWDMQYNNVVEFADETARNAYINSVQGYSIELPDGFRCEPKPDDYIKVPLPYANALKYNYAVIYYPVPPNAQKPLDYALNEPVYRYMYYFIVDTVEVAPNTTRLMLEPDIWQMWYYNVELKNLQLERGHYGVANSASIAEFLNNPINSTMWLLDNESFADLPKQAQTGSTFLANYTADQQLYVLFSLPLRINSATDLAKYHDKTYSTDMSPTYGNYGTDPIGTDALLTNTMLNVPQALPYEPNVQNFIGNTINVNHVPTTWYYCISLGSVNTLLRSLKDEYKYILNNIKKFYIISLDYINVQTITDVTLFKRATFKTSSKTLNIATLLDTYKSSVKYTKELTYPFLNIKFIKGNGDTIEIKSQDCNSDLTIFNNLNIANDELTIRSNIQGVNAGSNFTLNIEAFNNTSLAHVFKNDESYQLFKSFEIPTFAVYVNTADIDKYTGAGDRLIKQNEVENNYTQKVLSENCANDNIIRSSANKQNNAHTSNWLAKTTSDNSATAINTATKNSTATTETNINLSNSAASDNTTAEQGYISGVAAQNQLYNSGMNIINISRNQTSTQAQNSLQASLVDTGQTASAAQAVTGAIGGLSSGDLTGALLGGVSTLIGIAADQAKSNAIIGNNSDMYNASTVFDSASTSESNSFIGDKATLQSTYIGTVTANNVYASNTNAALTHTTDDTNADLILNATLANNSTAETNNNAIADANYSTEIANANENKATNILKAKIATEHEYYKNTDTVLKASYEPITQIGQNDYKDTQTIYGDGWIVILEGLKADTKQVVEDYFTKYGYNAGGKVIDSTQLQVMPYYTYIQARDVVVKPIACNAKNCELIKSILLHGCTVYSNPADIGEYFYQEGE